jgi:hypothetical protein
MRGWKEGDEGAVLRFFDFPMSYTNRNKRLKLAK